MDIFDQKEVLKSFQILVDSMQYCQMVVRFLTHVKPLNHSAWWNEK